jgi:type VI secretion system secreted protein Hcp
MALYMKFGDIDGDVTETGHPKWVELESFNFGVGRGISSTVGSSADRESTAPSISEVVVSKQNDVATGKLMQEALSGHGKLVKIDFTRTFKDKQEVYITLELTNTIISGYQHEAGGGGRPVETVSLNFTKVQFTTKQMAPDGTLGDPDHVTYDLQTAQTS